MKSKFLMSLFISAGLFSLPATSSAHNLMVSNGTSYDLAFTVNGVCHPSLMIYGYSIRSLSQDQLQQVCGNISECQLVAHKYSCDGANEGGLTIHSMHDVTLDGSSDSCVSSAVSVGSNKIDLFFSQANGSACLTKK